MLKKYCDRCGKEILPSKNVKDVTLEVFVDAYQPKLVLNQNTLGSFEYHLCDACHLSFCTFMQEDGQEE